MAQGLDDCRTTAKLLLDRGKPRRVTPQVRPDARDELAELDRLHQVVVGSSAETGDEGVFVTFAGQDDDWQGRRLQLLAKRAHDIRTGDARQARVEHDKADGSVLEACASKADRHERARWGVVVDDEDRSFGDR